MFNLKPRCLPYPVDWTRWAEQQYAIIIYSIYKWSRKQIIPSVFILDWIQCPSLEYRDMFRALRPSSNPYRLGVVVALNPA